MSTESSSSSQKITAFDWRSKNKLPDVGDQGTANCCYAFAILGVMESQYRIKKEVYIRLSRQDIFNQMMRITDQEKPGCTVLETLRWIADHGCISDKECPFDEIYNPIEYLREPCMTIGSFLPIDLTKEINFKPKQKRRLQEQLEIEIRKAPVIGEMNWIEEMDNVKGEVYSGPENEDSFGKIEKHGVMVVGFGEEMKGNKLIKYWIIQNSHGIGWGVNGFGKIDKSPCHGKLLLESAWIVRGGKTTR